MVGVDDVAVFVIESAVEIAPYVILFYPPCSQEVKTQINTIFFFIFCFFFKGDLRSGIVALSWANPAGIYQLL